MWQLGLWYTMRQDWTGLRGRAEQTGWSYTWESFYNTPWLPCPGSGVGGWEKQRKHICNSCCNCAITCYREALPPSPPKKGKQRLSLTYVYLHRPPTLGTGSAHSGESKKEQENCSLNDFSHVNLFEGGDCRRRRLLEIETWPDRTTLTNNNTTTNG